MMSIIMMIRIIMTITMTKSCGTIRPSSTGTGTPSSCRKWRCRGLKMKGFRPVFRGCCMVENVSQELFNLDTRRGKEGLVIALQGGEITTIAQIKKKLQVFLDDGVQLDRNFSFCIGMRFVVIGARPSQHVLQHAIITVISIITTTLIIIVRRAPASLQ